MGCTGQTIPTPLPSDYYPQVRFDESKCLKSFEHDIFMVSVISSTYKDVGNSEYVHCAPTSMPMMRHGSSHGLCQRCMVPLWTMTSPAPRSVREPSSSSRTQRVMLQSSSFRGRLASPDNSARRKQMVYVSVQCPYCHSTEVIKAGKQANGSQRYRCQNEQCARRIFLLQYQD